MGAEFAKQIPTNRIRLGLNKKKAEPPPMFLFGAVAATVSLLSRLGEPPVHRRFVVTGKDTRWLACAARKHLHVLGSVIFILTGSGSSIPLAVR